MNHLVSLHNNAHRNMRIASDKVEYHAADLAMVPVVVSEFLKLVVQYPIALTKNKETGQFVCVAMFGFYEGENLFLTEQGWDTLYTPLQVARQPFFLGENDQASSPTGEDQYIVCFDSNSDCIQDDGDQLLFDEQGKETIYLQNIQSILAELLEGEGRTEAFINKLMELQLLQPMRLDLEFVDGQSHSVNGMYTIDEDKLKRLSNEQIAGLHQSNYLSYIYAMIASMGQLYSLVQKKNALLSKKNDPSLKSA